MFNVAFYLEKRKTTILIKFIFTYILVNTYAHIDWKIAMDIYQVQLFLWRKILRTF